MINLDDPHDRKGGGLGVRIPFGLRETLNLWSFAIILSHGPFEGKSAVTETREWESGLEGCPIVRYDDILFFEKITGRPMFLSPAAFLLLPSPCLNFLMSLVRLLGLINGLRATILIDPSYPRSTISEAYLFRNDFNSVLGTSGLTQLRAALSVPSLGGFYTSDNFLLLGCFTSLSNSDVVLGMDWLSGSRVVANANVLARPAPEMVMTLQDGHSWTENGILQLPYKHARFADPFCRSIPPIFSPAHARESVPVFSGAPIGRRSRC